MTASDESQQHSRVPGDDQFFVRRDDPGRHAASCARNPRALSRIRLVIELDAQPRRRLADPGPDLRRVLADAGGEDQPVDPAQHAGERADLLGRLVDEIVDGQTCARARRSREDRACRC